MSDSDSNGKRLVYPLDVTPFKKDLKAAKRKTGIKSQAQILRMAIERGLPVLIAQLQSHQQGAGK